MRVILTLVLLGLAVAAPTAASNPGEPLDCSDWVFVEPGLSCSVAVADCDTSTSPWCQVGYNIPADNDGGLLALHVRRLGGSMQCGAVSVDTGQLELIRLTPTGEEILAYLPWRCGTGSTADISFPLGSEHSGYVTFDSKTGIAYFPIRTYCAGNSTDCTYALPPGDVSLVQLGGFTTDFEILSTYEPGQNAWGFRVPHPPEGFPAADWFNTYYGDLATVGDWSQTQPLRCAFPLTAPTVGDYITVNDPLPIPTPGTGRYYVTAVTYQGQIRYGRKTVNGVLSGRDPAVLPACNN